MGYFRSGRAIKFNEGMPSPYTAQDEFERLSTICLIMDEE